MLVDVIARLLVDEGIEIVGTALAAEETVDLAEGTQPDLAVIGLTLDRAKNVEILSRLRATNPRLKIVALLSSEDEIRFALAGGADACLSESAEPDDIRVVVRQVARQSIYLAPSGAEAGGPEAAADPELTSRQREVLGLIARGASNAEIAAMLWVTERTVKFHVSNIYRKLGVDNRTEATRRAFERGLAGVDDRSEHDALHRSG
jgi:DNA-binding NarL/FixJ family response regulator